MTTVNPNTDHHRPRPISRAALAALAGVSRAAITQTCRRALAPACVGRLVDANHPATLAYLADRRQRADRAPTVSSKRAASESSGPTELDADELVDLIVDVLERALRRVRARRGAVAPAP